MKRKKLFLGIILMALVGLVFVVAPKTHADNGSEEKLSYSQKFIADDWECMDDDLNDGIYRICNYHPLEPGNSWNYTTGDRFVVDDIVVGKSGYPGILYATTSYEFSSYMQNHKHGFMWNGVQIIDYNTDDEEYMDIETKLVFFPPEMEIGDTYEVSFEIFETEVSMRKSFVGTETITVEAGTFDTIKLEIFVEDENIEEDEYCSYKTTLWFAKGVGLVKIHRTEADPWYCDGCIFVCTEGDIERLNKPAELISYNVGKEDDQVINLPGMIMLLLNDEE